MVVQVQDEPIGLHRLVHQALEHDVQCGEAGGIAGQRHGNFSVPRLPVQRPRQRAGGNVRQRLGQNARLIRPFAPAAPPARVPDNHLLQMVDESSGKLHRSFSRSLDLRPKGPSIRQNH
jgi:hypothetical protein